MHRTTKFLGQELFNDKIYVIKFLENFQTRSFFFVCLKYFFFIFLFFSNFLAVLNLSIKAVNYLILVISLILVLNLCTSKMTELLETPIKSQNDKNLYRLIKLENGLKVLLIQHPENDLQSEKLAAVYLHVDVGGYDDPKDAKGLSHFLEHMVFLGSEKFPKENEVDEFINANGGYTNAMTGFKETIFFFSIAENALEGSVDRFSALFTSPLLMEHAIERELNAVESEYRNRVNDNLFRMGQLLYGNVKDDHQAHVFIPGNLETLKKNRSNSELYQLFHEHRQNFYVANRMKMAIESNLSLDDLQTLVEKYFKNIQSGTAREKFLEDEYKKMFKPQFYEKVLYMKPIGDMRSMMISWPLPPIHKYYKTNPGSYLINLFKSDHSGGLVSFLKKKLLITSMDVSCDFNLFGSDPIITFLCFDITMTEYGSKNVEAILEGIYSYILQVKETPMEKHKEIYENLQKIKEVNFRFYQTSSSLSNAASAVEVMNLYDDVDILRAKQLFLEFNGEIIEKFIDLLNESKLNILIIDHDAKVDYDEIEPYFKTKYKQIDLNEKFKKAWDEKKILSDLSLPPENEYTCSNFEIYADMDGVVKMVSNLC